MRDTYFRALLKVLAKFSEYIIDDIVGSVSEYIIHDIVGSVSEYISIQGTFGKVSVNT